MTLSPRAEAKRTQILDGARRVFLAHGLAGANTNTLAAEAGVSKQTLYAYFPSKHALLAAVLERELGPLSLPAGPVPESLAELDAILLRFARTIFSHFLTPDAISLLRILVGEAVRQPDLRQSFRETVPLQLLATVRGIFAHAHARGLVDAPQPEYPARLFLGTVMSYMALDGLLSDQPPVSPSDATLAHFVHLCLRAVEKRN